MTNPGSRIDSIKAADSQHRRLTNRADSSPRTQPAKRPRVTSNSERVMRIGPTAVKTAAVSPAAKRVLIALGVATYLGATAAATVYGSAALYMLFHKQRPVGITAGTIWLTSTSPSPLRRSTSPALQRWRSACSRSAVAVAESFSARALPP